MQMMMLALASVLMVPPSPATGTQPVVPRIACTFKMHAWCMVALSSVVEMSDDHENRIWSITDPLSMHDGPLVIVEKKSCDAVYDSIPRQVSENQIVVNEISYIAVRYILSDKDRCSLEFRLPMRGGRLDQIYRYFMRNDILVGGRQLSQFDR